MAVCGRGAGARRAGGASGGSGRDRGVAGSEEAGQDRPRRCPAAAHAAVGGPVPGVVDPAGARAGGPHPGPVVLHADGRAAGLAAAHPRPAVPPGLPTDPGAAVRGGPRGAWPVPTCRRRDGSTSRPRCGASMSSASRSTPLRTQLVNFARRQPGCRALQAHYGIGLVVRGDHLGRDRRCPPIHQFRSAGALRRAGCHRVLLGGQTLTRSSVPAGLPPAALGGVRGGQVRRPPGSPDHAYYHALAARRDGKHATLAVERKILRRCYHTLRELGDAALALPNPTAQGGRLKCAACVALPIS